LKTFFAGGVPQAIGHPYFFLKEIFEAYHTLYCYMIIEQYYILHQSAFFTTKNLQISNLYYKLVEKETKSQPMINFKLVFTTLFNQHHFTINF
jgi:hypothetical protein